MKKRNLFVIAPAMALIMAGCAAQAPAAAPAATAATEAATAATEAETEVATEAAEVTTEAAAEGKVIAPLTAEVDTANLADGIYSVEIKSVEKDGDQAKADLVIYTQDLYDVVDITTMQPGDTIVFRGEEVEVKSVEETEPVTLTDADGNEGSYAVYEVNGPIEEGGIELVAGEGGTYRYLGLDDHPTYTEHGDATVEIAADAVINDKAHILDDPAGQLSDEGVTMTTAEFADGFEEEANNHIPYTELNTTVRTEGGVIVEISRKFIP